MTELTNQKADQRRKEKKIESQHNTTAASDKIVSSQNILMWAYIIVITCLYEKVRKCVHSVNRKIQPNTCTDIHKMPASQTLYERIYLENSLQNLRFRGESNFYNLYLHVARVCWSPHTASLTSNVIILFKIRGVKYYIQHSTRTHIYI